jgi:DNA-binding NarL/FixJ family response regulator
MNEASAVRVLIVDDQVLMRDGLRTLLELEDGVCVVGTAAGGSEAVQQVGRLHPDVVLMDLRMPGMDGVAATRSIKERHPQVQVLVLTTFDDEESIFSALSAGASGYVLKDTPSEQLARDIQAVHSGESSVSPSVARKLITELVGREAAAAAGDRPTARVDADGREKLSDRELDVLRLAAQGLSNREIGRRLHITEGTVKNHISSVLSKLQLRDRTQAVIFAKEQGLL